MEIPQPDCKEERGIAMESTTLVVTPKLKYDLDTLFNFHRVCLQKKGLRSDVLHGQISLEIEFHF